MIHAQTISCTHKNEQTYATLQGLGAGPELNLVATPSPALGAAFGRALGGS